MIRYLNVLLLTLFLFSLSQLPSIAQSDQLPDLEDMVITNGTSFEIPDNGLGQLLVTSSAKLSVIAESGQYSLTLLTEASTTDTSSDLILSGLTPGKRYYLYIDKLSDPSIIENENSDQFSLTLDITQAHLLSLQEQPNTIHVPTDTSVGTWDPVSRIYTLNQDVTETIEITEDDITLEGNGYNVTSSPSGLYGVLVWRKQNVEIRNLNISHFRFGVRTFSSDNLVLDTINTSYNSRVGIDLAFTNNAQIRNVIVDQSRTGLFIDRSPNTQLFNNEVTNSSYTGLLLNGGGNSVLRNNILHNNRYNLGVSANHDHEWINDIDTSNLVDNKPVYYLVNASGVTIDSTSNAGAVYAINSDNINVSNLSLSKNLYGVYFVNTTNSAISAIDASNHWIAINLSSSANNSITGNHLNTNQQMGILVNTGSNNRIENNTLTQNGTGIQVSSGVGHYINNNTVTNGLFNGIALTRSENISMSSNILTGNRQNFIFSASNEAQYEHDISTSNMVDGKSIYYLKDIQGASYGSSHSIGTLYCIRCTDVVIESHNMSHNGDGVFLWRNTNSQVRNVNVSNSSNGISVTGESFNTTIESSTLNNNGDYGLRIKNSTQTKVLGNSLNENGLYGIHLNSATDNTISGNVVSNTLRSAALGFESSHNNHVIQNIFSESNGAGIQLLRDSSQNTILQNHVTNNRYGVYLGVTYNNTIYNNNFIDNPFQLFDTHTTSNSQIFNLAYPVGGNYWSDWTTPDTNNNGIVDSPYLSGNEVDNLPWTQPNGWLYVDPEWPQNSILTAEKIELNQLDLVWTPADYPTGVSTYQVYQDGVLAQTLPGMQVTTTISSLTANTTYQFKVEACNDSNQCTSDGPSTVATTLSVETATEQLINIVNDLNLHNGIDNSLDAKLEAAIQALTDLVDQNDVAAINALNAFINSVEAQRGQKIESLDADMLIYWAKQIINNI